MRRDKTIHISMNRQEFEDITNLAKANHISISGLIRQKLLKELEATANC